MREALTNLVYALPALQYENAPAIAHRAAESLKKMRPVQHSCLGSEHCYPAVAQNAIALAFPTFEQAADLSCEFRLRDEAWSPVIGEYIVLDKAAQ